MKKELAEKEKTAKTQKEKNKIQTNLVAIEQVHSRRPRCAYFGELQQTDASSLVWFGEEKATLHVAIDDATGTITGAHFDKEETLNAYYHVFHQIITNYGIPFKFFTDRRSIFTYKKKETPSIDEDSYTQFNYACKQLGVELESCSVPQSKGRVERLNATLQSRLPIELRPAGITTIDGANEFLNSYIKEFNAKFALPIDNITSVFEVQPPDEKINLILAVLYERTVDCGHCIKFNKRYYRMMDANGLQVHLRQGTKVMVIKAFDNSLYCCVNDDVVYVLDEIPEREAKSKNFDKDCEKPKPRKRYIPPMNHLWRRSEFGKFVRSQPHHFEDETVIGA
ncbi:MAG: ISNCY family transposase [Clostridia bacterium]|nr:ISNCY family transposase [Clostridia bacterium]